jgi:hypothetical protein
MLFTPSGNAPLVELTFASNDGRFGPLLSAARLDGFGRADLRAALRGAPAVSFSGRK